MDADDMAGLTGGKSGVTVSMRFTISGNASVANATVQVSSVTTEGNRKGEYSVAACAVPSTQWN